MCENQSKSSRPKSSRPKSSDKNTSRKEEDVPLDEIVENVSSYFKKFDHFKKYEKDIQKMYQKSHDNSIPDCWPVEFINEVWRITEPLYKYSGRKKCWSLAILLQVMKRSYGYDEKKSPQSDVKKESPQSGGDPSANEPVYIRIPFSEMINSKECYRSDSDTNIDEKNKESKASKTVEKNKESKASKTVEKNKESKASETDEKDKNKDYKLIDKVPSPTQILQNQFYIMLYDNQTRNAAWVYEILNESTLKKVDYNNANKKADSKAGKKADNKADSKAGKKADNKADSKASKKGIFTKLFKRDKSVHEEFRTPEGERPYSRTGYDRGHLAAAANHNWCHESFKDTYWLSNIIPQEHYFNSGIWLTLERLCRYLATENKEEVRNVHVYTGPLYLSKDKESEGNNDQNKSNELDDDINDQNKSNKLVNDVNATKKRKIFVENMIANDFENKRKKVNKKEIHRVEYEVVGGKAVPTHLFKVIIVENKDGKVLAPECYKIPNEKPPDQEQVPNASAKGKLDIQGQSTIEKCRRTLKEYEAKIEDIQRESGLIFEEREVKEDGKDNQRNSRLKEEITDETWKIKWTAENHEIWTEVKTDIRK